MPRPSRAGTTVAAQRQAVLEIPRATAEGFATTGSSPGSAPLPSTARRMRCAAMSPEMYQNGYDNGGYSSTSE